MNTKGPALIIIGLLLPFHGLQAQSYRIPWSAYGHNAQHDGIAATNSQPLKRILWQTPVDLAPRYNPDGELTTHYGSPLITRANTVIVPVKTGAAGGFELEAFTARTGATRWLLATDYETPPHDWVPEFSPALTPRGRLYFAGGGGTLYYCDAPDTSSTVGQIAFYGMANYLANSNTYLANVFVDTPIISDRYGNVFFGFQVTGSTPANLHGGIARIDFDGTGSWIAASTAAGDSGIEKMPQNSAPALSNDHKTLYVVVASTNYFAYLVALDSRSLAVLHSVRLKDAHNPSNDALVGDNASATPTIGPDGDVYFGVQENPLESNNNRGWLLHFDSTLTQTRVPGAFGWDATASIVPASIVPSYHASSSHLVMIKYNNYADAGGDGVNKLGLLDPTQSMTDPITGTTVMKEILTIAGPTPDEDFTNTFPNAVHEWCINSAAIDPFTKSVLANNEDGKLYRWDLVSNTLSETFVLSSGVGEAYTPTVVGVDGLVYAINNGILYAIGR